VADKVTLSKMTFILGGIAVFLLVNLAITVFLRYHNGNDGWLEYYHSIAKKQHEST